MIISGIHSLIEALQEGKPVIRVWIDREKRGSGIEKIKSFCRERGVLFRFVPAEAIQRKSGTTQHQGVCAEMADIPLLTFDELMTKRRSNLLLLLDGIEDTGNLGAILRTAAAVDVDGVILSTRRSAPVNDTVWKRSAGTMAKVNLAYVDSMLQAAEKVKKEGFWVVGACPRASVPIYKYDFRPPTAVIMGGEHRGLSPALQKKCDQLVAVPHSTRIESLNVSVAAAVILFEAFRQRLS